MTRIVFATFFVAVTLAHAQQNIPDGMPFGHVGDADIDRLQEFALKHGFDPQVQRKSLRNKRVLAALDEIRVVGTMRYISLEFFRAKL